MKSRMFDVALIHAVSVKFSALLGILIGQAVDTIHKDVNSL